MHPRTTNTNGTSFKGTVRTTFDKLEETFGPPCFEGEGDKVNADWCLLFKDEDGEGVVATIYDWKLPETPLGEYDWHIGGYTSEAVSKVREALGL